MTNYIVSDGKTVGVFTGTQLLDDARFMLREDKRKNNDLSYPSPSTRTDAIKYFRHKGFTVVEIKPNRIRSDNAEPRYKRGDIIYFRPKANANRMLGTILDSKYIPIGEASYTREYTIISESNNKVYVVLSTWAEPKIYKRSKI